MAKRIKLDSKNLKEIRKINPMLHSYNVQMTEVTGGTFWKEYTPEQVAGHGKFPAVCVNKVGLMQVYPPVNLMTLVFVSLQRNSALFGSEFPARGLQKHTTTLMVRRAV